MLFIRPILALVTHLIDMLFVAIGSKTIHYLEEEWCRQCEVIGNGFLHHLYRVKGTNVKYGSLDYVHKW